MDTTRADSRRELDSVHDAVDKLHVRVDKLAQRERYIAGGVALVGTLVVPIGLVVLASWIGG